MIEVLNRNLKKKNWLILGLVLSLPITLTLVESCRVQQQDIEQDKERDGGKYLFSEQIQGEIQDLRTIRIFDTGDQQVIAKVKTRDGRMAQVLLGPQLELKKLDLIDGDPIKIVGSRGTVNEHSILLARQVTSKNQTVLINRTKDKDLKKFEGEILQLRTTDKKGPAPRYLLARLNLDIVKTTVVNLGPEDNLQDTDLQLGERIMILAHPIRINGKTALIAEQIRIDGKTVDVNWDQIQNELQQAEQSAEITEK